MRDYIKQRHQEREYDDYLQRKVEAGRRQRDAGLHFSNEEVEAEAAARRIELLRRNNCEIILSASFDYQTMPNTNTRKPAITRASEYCMPSGA